MLLLALVVLLAAAGCQAVPGDARLQALGLHVTHHERIRLDVAQLRQTIDGQRVRRAGAAPVRLQLPIAAFGQRLSVQLEQVHGPFAPNYRILAGTEAGPPEQLHVDHSVFFRGHVARARGSVARATVSAAGIEATLLLQHEAYFVEPLHRYEDGGAATPEDHVIYRLSDVHPNVTDTHRTCGVAEAPGDHGSADSEGYQHYTGQAPAAGDRQRRALQPYDSSRRTCELYLTGDHRLYASLGSNPTAVSDLLIGFVEDLNLIYKFTEFTGGSSPSDTIAGINFAIRTMTVWTSSTSVINGETNPFATSTTDSQVFLSQLGTLNDLGDHCLGHAFTVQDFDSGVLGLAWRPNPRLSQTSSGVCSNPQYGNSYNTGITTRVNFGSQSPRLQVPIKKI